MTVHSICYCSFLPVSVFLSCELQQVDSGISVQHLEPQFGLLSCQLNHSPDSYSHCTYILTPVVSSIFSKLCFYFGRVQPSHFLLPLQQLPLLNLNGLQCSSPSSSSPHFANLSHTCTRSCDPTATDRQYCDRQCVCEVPWFKKNKSFR